MELLILEMDILEIEIIIDENNIMYDVYNGKYEINLLKIKFYLDYIVCICIVFCNLNNRRVK